MNQHPEISIVMPCLNEEDTIGICVEKAVTAMKNANLNGEVVVADNGSTDRSVEIAKSLGAVIVPVRDRGYGAALMGGIEASRGDFLIMGDCDDSYDFLEIPKFINELKNGFDLVMKDRNLADLFSAEEVELLICGGKVGMTLSFSTLTN